MGKIGKNQTGFSVVEVVLVLVIVGLVGVVGFMVYQNLRKTRTASDAPTSTTKPVTPTPAKTTTPTPNNGYLVIKEWGVKIASPDPISDATYQIVTNNKYIKPSAFLSTATLDASADCTSYYSKNVTPDDPLPTFQHIERFALTDSTSLDEGQTTITARQATQQQPATYKQVGNYVYYYRHGNGMPCQEQTTTQGNAFETAFNTIQAQ